MASSTSSSRLAPPAGGGIVSLRRRLGRPVPALPGQRALILATCAVLLGTTAWEFALRQLALGGGDIDRGNARWALQRRSVDAGMRESIVIIEDPRILFDTERACVRNARDEIEAEAAGDPRYLRRGPCLLNRAARRARPPKTACSFPGTSAAAAPRRAGASAAPAASSEPSSGRG